MKNEQRASKTRAEGAKLEKRTHPRFEVQYQLRYKQIKSKIFPIKKEYVTTFDICSRGVSMLVEKKVDVSSLLIMELIIPVGNSHQSAIGLGKVRWCQKSGEKYRIGLELMWVNFGTDGIDEISLDESFVSELKHKLERGVLHIVKDIGLEDIKSFLKLP